MGNCLQFKYYALCGNSYPDLPLQTAALYINPDKIITHSNISDMVAGS